MRRATSPQNITKTSSRNKDSDFNAKRGGISALPSLGFVYEYLLSETDIHLSHQPRVSTPLPACSALRFSSFVFLYHITDLVQTNAVEVLQLKSAERTRSVSVTDLTLLLLIQNMFAAQHSRLEWD